MADDCRLMAHLVAGYPDGAGALALARALHRGGADYLEIQFPFSDPTADGPAIERACHASLAGGFTVDGGFAFARAAGRATGKPVFVMTYASLVCARGVGRFVDDARAAGVRGLIIPDLPVDLDEGLYDAGRAAGLAVVPVVAPGLSDARLAMVRARRPEFVYTALRTGVTGRESGVTADILRHLDRLAGCGAKVVAGFGIRRREQLAAMAGRLHGVAAGTCFLDAMAAARAEGRDPYAAAFDLAAELRRG